MQRGQRQPDQGVAGGKEEGGGGVRGGLETIDSGAPRTGLGPRAEVTWRVRWCSQTGRTAFSQSGWEEEEARGRGGGSLHFLFSRWGAQGLLLGQMVTHGSGVGGMGERGFCSFSEPWHWRMPFWGPDRQPRVSCWGPEVGSFSAELGVGPRI